MPDLKLATPVQDQAEEWAEFSLAVQETLAFNDKVRESFHEGGSYRSPAFEPVRRLRLHPLLVDLDDQESAEIVHKAFCEIEGVEVDSERADHVWVKLLGDSDSKGEHIDPYDDFLYCWDECKSPGPNPLERAVQRAKEDPRPADYFGERFSSRRRMKYRRFLRVAEELQLAQGEQPILLPTTRLPSLLDTDQGQITRWRQLATKDGFLKQVAKYKRGIKADEFRFHLPPKVS